VAVSGEGRARLWRWLPAGFLVDRGRQPLARPFEQQPPRFTIPMAQAVEQTLKLNAAVFIHRKVEKVGRVLSERTS